MKVIDEKGKLFGKINIIDFLLIVLFVFVIPIFYFGHKILTARITPVEKPKTFVEIEVACKLIKIPPETVNLISIGDKETDSLGNTLAEITKTGDFRPYQYQFNIGQDELLTKEDLKLKELPISIKITAEAKNDELFYKDIPLKLQKTFYFKTDKYMLETVLIDKSSKKIGIKVKFKDLSPELSSLIKGGDSEKNSNGMVVAVITNIINNEPTKILILENNSMVMAEHPLDRDITTELLVMAKQKSDYYYFNNAPLRIGSTIRFSAEKYSIVGEIIEINE